MFRTFRNRQSRIAPLRQAGIGAVFLPLPFHGKSKQIVL